VDRDVPCSSWWPVCAVSADRAESLKTLTFDVFSGDTYFQAFSLQHVGLVFLGPSRS